MFVRNAVPRMLAIGFASALIVAGFTSSAEAATGNSQASADAATRGGGVLGGLDPARPYIEPAAAVQQHASYYQSIKPLVAGSGSVGLSGQVQQNAAWCVPASSATMLTTWAIAGVTQSWFATAEHTGSTGTYLSNAPGPINSKESHFAYAYGSDAPYSGSSVMNYASFDISHGAQEMIGVQGGDFGWWAQHNFTGIHAATLYGYNMGTGNLNVWDPLAQSWAGRHNQNENDAALAQNDSGGSGQVW